MSKRKLLSSAIAMSLIFGMSGYSLNGAEPKHKEPIEPRPIGYTHPPKTEEQKRLHKEHQKKIKAKRKAKKGIYEHKIVYKKAKR